jgi:trehalose synthase
MDAMQEVDVRPIPLDRLGEVLVPDRRERLAEAARQAQELLAGRTVWNLSSTAHGGGVAEMLQTLLAYGRGAGVDTRWLVLDADPEFFAITKRLHNVLHGAAGDGGPLGADEVAHYSDVLAQNLEAVRDLVRAGDVVLLHDPQTAGMVDELRSRGVHVVWRCHIGSDTTNEFTERGWGFLREFIDDADGFVFSRLEYAPDWVSRDRIRVIPPSLDPFSTKNAWLDEQDTLAVLRRARLVDTAAVDGDLTFTRRDGSSGVTRAHSGLLLDDDWLPRDVRTVMQVSRWDRLKDMAGVLLGFAEHVGTLPDDVHLLLVGPEVSGVTDDPEGAEVLAECRRLRRDLPAAVQRRVHLCCLPMDDVDENAHLVNALQRYATVVVQKSLVEGFGLTVTEPMWKGRPVIASSVGGIRDQIIDAESGLLLSDPHDLAAFAGALQGLLHDHDRSARLGANAHLRVRDRYLGDRHLIQYAELFDELVNS